MKPPGKVACDIVVDAGELQGDGLARERRVAFGGSTWSTGLHRPLV